MKSKIIPTVLLVSSSFLIPQLSSAKSEIYCGLLGEISHFYGKRSEINDASQAMSNNSNFSKTAPSVGFFIGCLRKFSNHFAFALEPHINYSSQTLYSTQFTDLGATDYYPQLKTSSNITFGSALKLGTTYFFDSFIYGLIGADSTDFKYVLNASDLTGGGLLNEGSQHKRIYGLSLGVGFEKSIAEHWKFGIEAKNTFYQNTDLKAQTTRNGNPTGYPLSSLHLKPRVFHFSFRLAYVF